MKQIIYTIILFFLSVISVDGQWYLSCGVNDLNEIQAENYDCLVLKTNRLEAAGITIGLLGLGGIIVGKIKYDNAPKVTSIYNLSNLNDKIGGGLLVAGSITIIIVGVSIFSAGASRSMELKNTSYYKSLQLESLNISPALFRNQSNNSYSLGMTATLSF